jgi:hypothetical protein
MNLIPIALAIAPACAAALYSFAVEFDLPRPRVSFSVPILVALVLLGCTYPRGYGGGYSRPTPSSYGNSAGDDDSERATVCAKYRVKYGWSEGYRVAARVVSGGDLNRATQTYDYQPFSKYVVIFWAQGEATLIELDYPYLNAYGTTGKDRAGREWEISTTSYCY